MQSIQLKWYLVGDLFRESLLPSLVCYCVLLACNIYLDEIVFGFGGSIVSEFCMIFICVDDYAVQVGEC